MRMSQSYGKLEALGTAIGHGLIIFIISNLDVKWFAEFHFAGFTSPMMEQFASSVRISWSN
jgi:hypothetical protein